MASPANRTPGDAEQDIARRYTAGEPAETIAADHGVDKATVWVILRRLGVPLRGHPARRTLTLTGDEILDAIADMTRQGIEITPHRVARHLGISDSSAERRMVTLGVWQAVPPGVAKRAARLHERGHSIGSVAETLGIPWQRARYAIIQGGGVVRGRGRPPARARRT